MGGEEGGYRFPEDFGHVTARLGSLHVCEVAIAVETPLGGERGVEGAEELVVGLGGSGRRELRRGVMRMGWLVVWFVWLVVVIGLLM